MFLLLVAILATPEFPAVIQQQLGLTQPPPCTVCHATDAGGPGTVVKPFGKYLVSRGLVPFDDDSLRNALLADIGEHHSSGGGLTDIDALKAGQDPNGTQGSGPVPAYGCSTAGPTASLLTLLVAGTWLMLRRRGRTSAAFRSNCSTTRMSGRLAGSPHREIVEVPDRQCCCRRRT
jgi:uncharacterized protein (TIGR03382 family)